MPRSRTFKIFHTFYLLVIAVLLTLIFVERQKQPDELSTSALSEQLDSAQESLATRVRDLSAQMDSRFAALEERLPQPQEYDEPRRTTAPSIPQDKVDEPPESTMSSKDYARLGSAMVDDFDTRQAAFEMQPVDSNWAYPSLGLIREQFAAHDYLRELHLRDIECRSSICQLDIDIADPASINPARLLQALNGVNDNDQGLEYELLSRPLDNTYRVLLIRANNGED